MWHSEMEGIGVDDGHGNDGGSLRRWCWRVKTAAVWKGEVGGLQRPSVIIFRNI